MTRRATFTSLPRDAYKAVRLLRRYGWAHTALAVKQRLPLDRWRYGLWRSFERRPGDLPDAPGLLLSVVMPVYGKPDELDAAIWSLRRQTWRQWELCAADDASPDPRVLAVLDRHAGEDTRVRPVRRQVNEGISAATNTALAAAAGQYVVFMDHDDVLAPDALGLLAAEFTGHPECRLVFSDEDKIDGDGARYDPYFKPSFNRDLLLAQNVVSHLSAAHTELVREMGGLRPDYDGSQDHDLVLRLAARLRDDQVRHVPHVLYHWRQGRGQVTFSSSDPGRAASASRRAVADRVASMGASVRPIPGLEIWNEVEWPAPCPRPSVSVVILAEGADCLARVERTVTSIERTAGVDVDVAVAGARVPVSATPSEPAGAHVPVVELSGYSRSCPAEIMVLIGAGVEPQGEWLDQLLRVVMRPGVQVVGGRIDSHAGRVLAGGLALGVGDGAREVHRGLLSTAPGYYGRVRITQDVSAVGPGFVALRRAAAAQLDADAPSNAAAVVDVCLHARASGQRVIWHPRARAAASPEDVPDGLAAGEMAWLRERRPAARRADPYYSPVWSRAGADFRLPVRGAAPRLAAADPTRR